jgi:hypothetical protein
MTNEEIRDAIVQSEVKEKNALRDLAVICRGILPVLQDHSMPNVADQLARKLFELDAIAGEREKMIVENYLEFVRFMADTMKKI